MSVLSQLPIKIFADGADLEGIQRLALDPLIQGITTNPTLMRKGGVMDYEIFAKQVLAIVHEKPVSFEVFADDFSEMGRQARKIAAWQENVLVKIPITNMQGASALGLVQDLVKDGVKVNVTALLTLDQVRAVSEVLSPTIPAIVSLFCGRIADTGRNPIPDIREAHTILSPLSQTELLWASVREVLNIFQAAEAKAHIVTVTHDILAKALLMAGQDLSVLSLETVKMFGRDAAAAGYRL
jgi:transaldolase